MTRANRNLTHRAPLAAYTSLLRIALPSSKLGLQRTITAVSSHSHHSHSGAHAAAAAGSSSAAIDDDIPARAPSPVPTLPGRAASVLYPDEGDDEVEREVEQERPQFVLGDDDAGPEGEEDIGERRRKVEAIA